MDNRAVHPPNITVYPCLYKPNFTVFGDSWISMAFLIPIGIALFLPAMLLDAIGVEGLFSGLDVFNLPSTKGLWLSCIFWVLISAIFALINFFKWKYKNQ